MTPSQLKEELHNRVRYGEMSVAMCDRACETVDAMADIIRRTALIIDPECPDIDAYVDGHCGLPEAVERLTESKRGLCTIKREEYNDDISGHFEVEVLTLCGEFTCIDECWESWSFCPYCGKPFIAPEAREPIVINLPDTKSEDGE